MEILRRRRIMPGNIQRIQCPVTYEERYPKELELVLVSDENKAPYGPGLKGLGLGGVSPVLVLGVREKECSAQPSMWREGYIIIPGESYLFTSPVASKFIPASFYYHVFDDLRTADEVFRLKQDLGKKGFVH